MQVSQLYERWKSNSYIHKKKMFYLKEMQGIMPYSPRYIVKGGNREVQKV